eukprot:Opistho-2@91922
MPSPRPSVDSTATMRLTGDDIPKLNVRQLKEHLSAIGVDSSECVEKHELVSLLTFSIETKGGGALRQSNKDKEACQRVEDELAKRRVMQKHLDDIATLNAESLEKTLSSSQKLLEERASAMQLLLSRNNSTPDDVASSISPLFDALFATMDTCDAASVSAMPPRRAVHGAASTVSQNLLTRTYPAASYALTGLLRASAEYIKFTVDRARNPSSLKEEADRKKQYETWRKSRVEHGDGPKVKDTVALSVTLCGGGVITLPDRSRTLEKGDEYKFEARLLDKVGEVKMQLAEMLGIPPAAIDFRVAARSLPNRSTLAENDIVEGANIFMFLVEEGFDADASNSNMRKPSTLSTASGDRKASSVSVSSAKLDVRGSPATRKASAVSVKSADGNGSPAVSRKVSTDDRPDGGNDNDEEDDENTQEEVVDPKVLAARTQIDGLKVEVEKVQREFDFASRRFDTMKASRGSDKKVAKATMKVQGQKLDLLRNEILKLQMSVGDDDVEKRGWLVRTKMKNKVVKDSKWKKRFCVLQSEIKMWDGNRAIRDVVLLCYKEDPQKSANAELEMSIDLRESRADLALFYRKKEHVFYVTTNVKDWVFQAESAADMLQWVKAIQTSVHGKGDQMVVPTAGVQSPAAAKKRAAGSGGDANSVDPMDLVIRAYDEGDRRERAIASCEYIPINAGSKDLEFGVNDVIIVSKKNADGWWEGECRGKTGQFPSSFVEILDIEKLKAKKKASVS